MFMNESGDAEIMLEPDKSRSSYMYTADLIFVMTLYIACTACTYAHRILYRQASMHGDRLSNRQLNGQLKLI